MSRYQMKLAGMRAVLTSLLLTVVFAAGSATGIYLYPRMNAATDDHDLDHANGEDHAAESEDQAHEEDHVALSEQAYTNLKLRMDPVTKGDFWKTLLVPSRIVEIPARSDLSVSAPVTGVVEHVHVFPGQSLKSNEPLFVIRLTDEALIDAQSKLLETLTRQEVASQKIARLNPLTESGAISGAKTPELEYELKQLLAKRSTLLQELQCRGLPQSIIDNLLADRVLASSLTFYPPSFVGGEGRLDSERASSGLSVEDLVVHPGKSVSRGEPLCSVAYHSKLYLEGTAFEDDLPILERIAENAWQITIESRGPSAHDRESLYLQRLNPAIEKVARYLNIYAAAGKEKTTGNFALVFHGDATLAILNSEAYQTEFGTKGNPNSELLTQLHEAGVEMYVCGQSLHAKGKRPQDVLVFVKTAVSAPTASVNLQSEG